MSGIFGKSGQTFSVTPMTSCPACLSKAAVTELSTPPDMPTITRAIGGILSESELHDFAHFVHWIGFCGAPRADRRGGCVGANCAGGGRRQGRRHAESRPRRA